MKPDERDPLEIEVQQTEGRTLVMVAGDLDASTASHLYDALSDLELAEARQVVIDLAKVTFMDSTGLSVLVTEHKRLEYVNGHLTIFLSALVHPAAFRDNRSRENIGHRSSRRGAVAAILFWTSTFWRPESDPGSPGTWL